MILYLPGMATPLSIIDVIAAIKGCLLSLNIAQQTLKLLALPTSPDNPESVTKI
jgi:hypothetical protein